MKKSLMISGVIIISLFIFMFCFEYKKPINPHSYYQVYLDGKVIGTIKSKRELEDYINNQGDKVRNNVKEYNTKLDSLNNTMDTINKVKLSEEEQNIYNTYSNLEKAQYALRNSSKLKLSKVKVEALTNYIENRLDTLSKVEIKEMQDYVDLNAVYLTATTIYTPNGIEIKKVATYKKDVNEVTDIYAKIIKEKNCTVAGYKFTVTKDDKEKPQIIYVTDNEIFSQAVDKLAEIFTGSEQYNSYKQKSQSEIVDTGSKIENVYVDDDITYKAMNVSTDEKIYTNADDLAKYLLYGDNYTEKKVKVEEGDSIASIAFNNKISVSEFLISNEEYSNEDNLLYPGKEVVIAEINPQISVVVEKQNVEDVESNFNIVEQYDDNMLQGDEEITQTGEKGLDRVTQSIKYINGQVNFVQTDKKETLKAPTTQIVTVGSKIIPNVGSTRSWGWPTNSGYTISSGFGYRVSPVGNGHELHTGVDISGTGYGSPAYVTNNGTIMEMSYHYSYGNNILVDHGNGFYTLYAHLSGFAPGMKVGRVVERGEQIGMIGATGAATGPHLHYEIRTCERYACITNPLNYY